MLTSTDFYKAEQNGISKKTVISRKYLGWTNEDAVNKPLRSTERRKWMKIAEQNGISKGSFDNRVYSNSWDFERAATEPIDSSKRRKVSVSV